MAEKTDGPPAVLGWLGFAFGAAALVLTIVMFWAGPFAPQQSAGVSLGELAADIARSAARSVAGQPQPEPETPLRDIDDVLQIGVGLLAALAVVAGMAGLVRRETGRAALAGMSLGALAVGFQLFTWTVMAIVGGLAVAAVVYALRDAFGDILGGLFDG
ncbi:hypothetical protein KUH32_03920 [Thalassococcus sp. CAU 1522]|uniref:Uncharacterized protein n=1 Tax=Thalassococcus arenae TaxID=2851652 RepID=A0ABS6N4H2_9RHOB|nr:hypothetical protein [Thalassococcus arenae]MBV2358911.1 hypothetical protein [Thalassococcus arenae]